MGDANRDSVNLRNRLFHMATIAAILGLSAFAYRMLFDFDPATNRRGLEGSDAAFFSPTGNHPFFVYSIAAWISFQRRGHFFGHSSSRTSLAIGLVLVGGATAICAWSYHVKAPDLLIGSLALAYLGLHCLLGGREALFAAWLPSIVLLALIPIPAVLVNALVYKLQITTSVLSVGILNGIGFEAVRSADIFAVGDRLFQVIESCSGLRSIQTLFLSAILYQEIAYRSRAQSLLLVALAPFVGFVINEVRVLTLVFNPYSELASVHAAQGILMLVIGVLVIAGLDALLSRFLPAKPPGATCKRDKVSSTRLALATIGIGCIAATSLIAPSPNITLDLEWDPHDIPLRISGWRSQSLKLDREYMGSSRFSKDANRRFQRGDERIDVFVGVSERGQRSSSVLSPKTLILGPGRVSTIEESFSMGPNAPGATATTLRSHEGLSRVVRWHTNVETLGQETFRALFALDRGPSRRPGLPQVIRLSTPIAGGHEIDAADSRLRAFGFELLDEIAALEQRTRETRRR